MAEITIHPESTGLRLQANFRTFVRWLTSARVVLSLIMLAVMFVMVVIPLYRLVATTLTWGPNDIARYPEAVQGELTIFHYIRMLTGKLGQIYTYAPLQHSMTVAIGSTLLALLIGGSLAWLVVRTDMPGRKLINQLAVIPYIMPSWTLAQAWLVFFKNRLSGGTPGCFRVPGGTGPSRLAVVWAGADHHLQRAALLHVLFPVRVGGADVDRFQPGRSRRSDGRQPLAHPAQDHLPARHAGRSSRVSS